MRLAILWVTVCAACASAQQFEVASIKTVTTESNSSGIKTGHGRLDATNVTLQRCIIGAWVVGPTQIVGGPAWLTTDRFEISAKGADPIDDDAVLNLMLRRLLADRFQLALHSETRTMEAYVLEVAKGGPNVAKLKKTAEPTPLGTSTNTSGTNTQTSIEARQTSMDLFARVLARELRLPVVDRTGLAGDFDFKLSWTPDRIRHSPARFRFAIDFHGCSGSARPAPACRENADRSFGDRSCRKAVEELNALTHWRHWRYHLKCQDETATTARLTLQRIRCSTIFSPSF